LQTFTSTLVGQQHVSPDTNPFQPPVFARALWNACSELTSAPGPRSLLLRTCAGVMSGQLKKAWAAACTRLESQGVEPSIYRTVVFAPGPKGDRTPTFDVTRPGMLEALLPRMPAVGGGVSTAASLSPSMSGPAGRPGQAPNPALEEALQRLETLLRNAGGPGTVSGAALSKLADHRDTLTAATTDTANRQIVELLSRLFDAVLADSRLPPAFRGVMGRIQVSALRVALADHSMLEGHEYPVWRFINRIGLAAETYTRTTDSRWTALLSYCEKLVAEIAQAPVQDALLYRLSLSRLESVLAEQLREQQQRAQAAIDALSHAQRRGELEVQIAQRLHEQLRPIRVTAAVRGFICGAWSKALAESMLVHGEKGEATVQYMKATDDLLWTLRLPDHPQSRRRLLVMLPGLLQKLREGLALAGIPESEQQTGLDELMALHAGALRPGNKAPAAQEELTAEQIVQRMREESDWALSTRPPFSDSLIDLGSMETVPAELMPGTISSHDEARRRVDTMTVGSRHHMFLRGRWSRVQLLWRSGNSEYFLFAGPAEAPTHSMTRRALERLNEEGLLKPLDDVSLVQRAVDSLVIKLSTPA